MSIATKFESFCTNILISKTNADNITKRYEAITKRLNKDFWNIDSEIKNTLFVGSYGRDTDIHVSDVDVIFEIPFSIFEKYNNYIEKGQSALLQNVKNSIQKTYPTTDSHGDGQVVAIDFNDGINFEIVPALSLNNNNGFLYPNTNNGGSWEITKPFDEIQAIREKNKECNYNLKRLCRMIRAWKDNCNVPIGGLLIDTFAYNFLKDWKDRDKSFFYYDWMVRDFFEYLKNQNEDQEYWLAPGSNQRVNRKGKFNYKAKQAYNNILEAIEDEKNGLTNIANISWKKVFGYKF